MNRKAVFILSFMLIGILPSLAQQSSYGRIVYAEGKDFSLVRDGERRIISLDDMDIYEFDILEKDYIQTFSNTFLEVQLYPRGTILKIAENSSFQFNSFGPQGENVDLDLVYGRVRAKVAKLTGNDTFNIRSRGTVAGVRGTDFGFDSIISPNGSREADALSAGTIRVYCFSGEVALIPKLTVATSLTEAPAVIVKSNEVASLNPQDTLPVVERKALDIATLTYWSINDFKGIMILPIPESPSLEQLIEDLPGAGPASPGVVEITYIPPDYSSFIKTNRLKNNAIVGASFFSILGIALQGLGVAYNSVENYDQAQPFIYSGSLAVGLGALTLIASLFINPPSP